jgi:hypothetical protein
MLPIPHGPKGNWLSGNLPAFGADPLRFLTELAATKQPITRLRFFNREVFFLHRADLKGEAIPKDKGVSHPDDEASFW